MEKGDKFGRLTIVEVRTKRYNTKKQTYPFALVECECGVKYDLVERRINLLGWAPKKALTKPNQYHKGAN